MACSEPKQGIVLLSHLLPLVTHINNVSDAGWLTMTQHLLIVKRDYVVVELLRTKHAMRRVYSMNKDGSQGAIPWG